MQGYYIVTETIKAQLELDPFVNTVNTGIIEDVLLKKADMYPYSHILVNNSSYQGNTWVFNLSVICMDIVDLSKDEVTEVFYGNDNQQDVLNTQLAVINRMLDVLQRGQRTKSYILDGAPNCEPFIDRFEHGVAGWTVTFDIRIPNTMTVCGTDVEPVKLCPDFTYLIKDSADNTLYTGSILSGNGLTQTITDGKVTNSLGAVLGNVLAQGSLKLDDVKNIDSDGSTVPTPAGVPFTCTPVAPCEDATVTLNSITMTTIPSGDTEDISVRQSSGATEVGSKQGVHWRIADSDITLNSGAFLSVKAEDSQDIELVDQTDTTITPLSIVGNKITVDVPVGGGFTDMKLLPRDLLTNYGTGDQPTRGRATDFFTLNYTNEWGHSFRFVGQTGGYTDGTSYFDVSGVATTKALAFPNDIIYDFTSRNETEILSYYIGDSTTFRSYDTSLPLHVSSTFGGLTAWYLWNDFEVRNVMSLGSFDSLGHWMSHKPFEFNSSTRYFITSTRSGINITRVDLRSLAYIQATTLTNASLQVYVRYTTLTEMGL
jgi:hypothetical protein